MVLQNSDCNIGRWGVLFIENVSLSQGYNISFIDDTTWEHGEGVYRGCTVVQHSLLSIIKLQILLGREKSKKLFSIEISKYG